MESKFYELPALPYDYKALEPYISEEQLRIHHDKHHQAYVDGANALLRNLMPENLVKHSMLKLQLRNYHSM